MDDSISRKRKLPVLSTPAVEESHTEQPASLTNAQKKALRKKKAKALKRLAEPIATEQPPKKPKKKQKGKASVAGTASSDAMTVIIGGLPYSSTEASLSKDFGTCGTIQKLTVSKDRETGCCRGFAFLVFATKEGVNAALKFDGKDYCGRRVTARMAGDKPNSKQSHDVEPTRTADSELTVFVGGLPHNVTQKSLRKQFFNCGDIQALKLPLSEAGQPRGIAFITFKDQQAVERALRYDGGSNGLAVRMSGQPVEKTKGKGHGKDSSDKGKGFGKGVDFTVFVQGLTYSVTEKKLRKVFSRCGEIANIKLPMLSESESRGFAFISFKDNASVEEALKVDGDTSMSYDDCYVSVQKAVDHEEATRKKECRQAGGSSGAKPKERQHKAVEKDKQASVATTPRAHNSLESTSKKVAPRLTGTIVESEGKQTVFDSDDDT